MLELFLTALEDQLGLIVNPPLAPIARMNIISLEITRLTRAAELPLERNGGACPNCNGEKYVERLDGTRINCEVCGGLGHV